MAKSTILMTREGQNPVLHWTNYLTCSRRKEGSFSLWVVQESAYGKVSRNVVKRSRSVKKMIAALLLFMERSDPSVGYGTIVNEICPRLSQLDQPFAEALERKATQSLPPTRQKRRAA